MKENIAIEVLEQVKNALDKYNIVHWLNHGTLLGAVRDGKFIPWDHDIDLGTWCENIPQIVSACRELWHRKFTIRLTYTGILIRKEDCPLGISFYYLNNNNAVRMGGEGNYGGPLFKFFEHAIIWGPLGSHYSKVKMRDAFNARSLVKISLAKFCSKLHMSSLFRKVFVNFKSKLNGKFRWIIPMEYFMNLSTIKFYGMEFKVPAKTEEYLAFRYGGNWHIPKKDWVTLRDDGGIISVKDYREGKF